MTNLVILPELKNLLPPLTESEYAGLEKDILERGCISPLATWNDAIVDGHNRYEICQKHGLPFEVRRLEFASLDEARFWAWTHQENRRNLTAFQRAELALLFKPMFVAQGKEKMSLGGSKKSGKQSNEGCQISDNLKQGAIDVKKSLAKTAGVSHDTMHKAEFLSEYADEETKNNLRQGKTTINREYRRAKEQAADPKSQKTNDTTTLARPMTCVEELGPPIVRTTLQNIRQNKPDHLLINLNMHFREGFINELMIDGMAYLHEKHGDTVTEPIALEIAKRYIKGFDAFLKKQSRHS